LDRSASPPLRSLPRAFVPLPADWHEGQPLLPDEEAHKFHHVLRLAKGAQVALLPGDGRVMRTLYQGRQVEFLSWETVSTEPARSLRVCLGLAKPEALEDSLRLATEIGAAEFVLFPSDRSVVKWEPEKWAKREERLRRIVREATEVAFRTKLPAINRLDGLRTVLDRHSDAIVLSEVEGVPRPFRAGEADTVVIGPEGGWAPREVELIGYRARTLGPRVMRVATAVAATCALALAE
jgi:16S rRNA (uracil1498-N3)-methyltransferase